MVFQYSMSAVSDGSSGSSDISAMYVLFMLFEESVLYHKVYMQHFRYLS